MAKIKNNIDVGTIHVEQMPPVCEDLHASFAMLCFYIYIFIYIFL